MLMLRTLKVKNTTQMILMIKMIGVIFRTAEMLFFFFVKKVLTY